MSAKCFEYHVNLDERGEFHADVRNPKGETVWETNGEAIADGYMRNKADLTGLRLYLVELGIMTQEDGLVADGGI